MQPEVASTLRKRERMAKHRSLPMVPRPPARAREGGSFSEQSKRGVCSGEPRNGNSEG